MTTSVDITIPARVNLETSSSPIALLHTITTKAQQQRLVLQQLLLQPYYYLRPIIQLTFYDHWIQVL